MAEDASPGNEDLESADTEPASIDEPEQFATPPPPSQTESEGVGIATSAESADRTDRDWMLPAALLGGFLLLVIVFGVGLFVGRATDGSAAAENRVWARVDDLSGTDRVAPRDGYWLHDLGQRGPRGRLGRGELFRFDNLERLPDDLLDRICELIEGDALPDRVPFADRLAELCDDAGA